MVAPLLLVVVSIIREERIIVGLEAEVRIRFGIAIVTLVVTGTGGAVIIVGRLPAIVNVIAGRWRPPRMCGRLPFQNDIQSGLAVGILPTAAGTRDAIGTGIAY